MPTYVYRCKNGHTFELFHSISDESPRRCPRCRAAAKRVPAGGGGFLFKGSGFYTTDYRSKSYKDAAKSEQGKKPSAGTGGSEGGASPGKSGAPASEPPRRSAGAPAPPPAAPSRRRRPDGPRTKSDA